MSEIRLERASGVAIVTLAAPARRNALTASMVAELIAACEEVDADPTVGAAVVTGEGESFCAGAHRDTLAGAGLDPARPDNYEGLGRAYSAFVRVGELRVPTVAAVRGHAVGAGVNLMLAADLRVIAHDARVMTRFLRLGIHPGGGHFALLGRLAGREASAALSLFGEEVDGRRAADLGLAWESRPAAEVLPRAIELAERAAADPDLARMVLSSFRTELGPPALPWTAALEVERARQMWSLRRQAQRNES